MYFNQMFFKCIHYKDEISVIIYFEDCGGLNCPIIMFKEFDTTEQKFKNFFTEGPYASSGIILNRKIFH